MKRKSKRPNSKKNMRGGYTQEENQQLLNLGFTEQFLQLVRRGRIGFNRLLINLQESGLTPEQYMQQTYDSLEINPDEGFTSGEESSDEQQGGRKRKSKRRRTTRKYKR